MNYRQSMEEALVYIEHRLDKELTIAHIAEVIGYSPFHFSRVFHACKGMPVMEYVRQRRMSNALNGLSIGKSTLDVALESGFENHSAFSRAFKRIHGFSPNAYKKLKGKEMQNMNYQIVQRSSFKLAGFLVDTPISGTSTADAPVYWENIPPNWEGVLYDRLNPPKHGEYCLCFPSDKEEEKLVYFMAVAVDDFSNVTDDIKTLEVPEATYAVFTTQPVNQVGGINDDLFTAGIRSLWKYIFEEWFPESGFEYDMSSFDFEYYDERCHHTPNSVMEIYVPVKKAKE